MKILIINPNSDKQMSLDILKSAENYSGNNIKIYCKNTPGAPHFIENYEDISQSGPGMINLARKYESEFDAFIIACHYDPNLDMMKEILNQPVIGIGEASIKIASMIGHKFSIITTDYHSIPIHEELVRKYHLYNALASVRAPALETRNLNEKEKYLHTSKLAIEKDCAEVIVLGCAGLTGLDKFIQKKLDVPVLDGVACALFIAAGLCKIL